MTRESSHGQGPGLPDQQILIEIESVGRKYLVFDGGPKIAGYATGETPEAPSSFLDLLPTIPLIQSTVDSRYKKLSYPLPLILDRAASAARAYALPRDDQERQDVPRAVARIGQERDHFSAALDAFSKGIHPPSFREQGYAHIYTTAEGTCYIPLERNSQMSVVRPTEVVNFLRGTNQSMIEQTGYEASIQIPGASALIPISALGISTDLYDAARHSGRQVINAENTLLFDILNQQGIVESYNRWCGSPARTGRANELTQPEDYATRVAPSLYDCFGADGEKEIRDGLFEQYRAVAYVPDSPLINAITNHVKGLDNMYAAGRQHLNLPPQPLSEPQYTLHLLRPSQG